MAPHTQERRDSVVNVRVTERARLALEALAAADHRALSQYISVILERHVAEQTTQRQR